MKNFVSILIITVAAAVVMGGLLRSPFGTGPMLYVVVPFIISVVIYFIQHRRREPGINPSLSRHLLLATVVFLGASVLMMEGVICIAMFAPIYYAIVGISYSSSKSAAWRKQWEENQRDLAEKEGREYDPKKDSMLRVVVLPVILFFLATDGMLPQTTFPRDRTATYVTVTDQNIETLKTNMALPLELPRHHNWWLQMFPGPDRIKAGTLAQGDVHNLHFTYKRWIWSNFQKGEMDVLIAEVGDRHIRTEITKNTSYLSHYMEIKGTDVRFTPLANGQTEVSLTVKYRRLLDPAWYFGPLQQFAADKSAEYLVKKIIVREEEEL